MKKKVIMGTLFLNNINTMIDGLEKHFTFSYDNIGRRSSLTMPNGVTTNYNYDNGSRLLSMEHKNPAQQVIESVAYAYDAVGNRISMTRPSVNLPLPNQVTNTAYNESNQMLMFNDKNIVIFGDVMSGMSLILN